MPRVSVVIPTHDRSRWVGEAVDSVLAQSFGDHEVIVVEDGSTDGTDAMLAARFGDRIRVVRLPHNQGRSTARNVGWALARGEFVAFLDSDDLWLPDKLTRQIPAFDDPEVALVHCRVGKTDASGARLEAESVELEELFAAVAERGYGYGGITRTWCRMYTSAVVVRRDLLQKLGGFDPRLSNFEDWDVLWRIARAGRVATIENTLVLHRTHPGNTRTIWTEAATPWLAVNRHHLSEVEASPHGPEDRQARGNLLLNIALGEYWRQDFGASRRWMWRALRANPTLLARPGNPVWCAPLLNSLMPHRLAAALVARVGADRYLDGPA